MNGSEHRAIERRATDRAMDEEVRHLISMVDDLEERIQKELHDLDGRIELKLEKSEMMIAEKAVNLAVHRAFSHLGVNVDDPKDLQTFRDDLRFGGVFRVAAQKSFLAIIAAIFGGIGLSLWLVFKERVGLP